MDIDRFISEIHSRPAIWDLHSDIYSNRNEKVKAWEEICELFIKNFKDKSNKEKSAAGKLTFSIICVVFIHILFSCHGIDPSFIK